MKRGLGRLYDAVIDAGKAVTAAFRAPRRGERGMARLQGPYGTGSYGAPLLNKSEQVLHFKGWTYRCIDHICSRVANEPPTAVRAVKADDQNDLNARKVPRDWRRKAQGPAKPDEEYEFLPDDDPLVRLLRDPNDPETGVSFWYEAELFFCLCGEDFIWVVEDGAGRASELWVIPSHWVRPVCEGKTRLVDYYEVGPRGTAGEVVEFDPGEVIWHKKAHPLSKLLALSPTQAAAHVTDQYEMTEAARTAALQNAAVIGGTFKTPPEVALDDTAITRLEARFAQKYRGVFNQGRPLILEAGMEWVPPPPAQELAYMQSQDQLRKFVMAHWGLDEAVLGFSSVANRAAMVAAVANVNEATINPRRKGRAAVLTEKLARRFYHDARIFWPDDTPLDPDARRADFDTAIRAKAVSVNDVRTHLLQLEPYPEEEYDRPEKVQPPGTGEDGKPGHPRERVIPGLEGTRPGGQAAGMRDDADRSPGKGKSVNRVAALVTANGAATRTVKVRDDGGHEHRPRGVPRGRSAPAGKRFDPSEARDALGRWTAGAGVTPAELPPGVRDRYAEDFAHALASLPPGVARAAGDALDRGRVVLHPDVAAVSAACSAGSGRAERGVAGFVRHLPGGAAELHADGGPDPRGTYVHELWHAADHGHFYSDSKGWQSVYRREIKNGRTLLSRYALTSPTEGFAEFGRLLAARGTEFARANYPACCKYLEKEGLL